MSARSNYFGTRGAEILTRMTAKTAKTRVQIIIFKECLNLLVLQNHQHRDRNQAFHWDPENRIKHIQTLNKN